jgi:hypothetical protein
MDQLGFSILLDWRAQSNGARLRLGEPEQRVVSNRPARSLLGLSPWNEMDRLAIGLLVAGVALGGVIAVAAGWHGLVIYGFLAILLGGASFGLRVGGGIIRDASAHRFERDRRRS